MRGRVVVDMRGPSGPRLRAPWTEPGSLLSPRGSATSQRTSGPLPAGGPTMPGMTPTSSKLTRGVAALAAVAALAFGANAVANNNDTSTTATAGGAPTGARQSAPPDMGTAVTGSTLTQLKSVATAKYPGTVERAMKLSDGSYVVHVKQTDGTEVHVRVSAAFAVTGVDDGPPSGGAPPSGGSPPSTTKS